MHIVTGNLCSVIKEGFPVIEELMLSVNEWRLQVLLFSYISLFSVCFHQMDLGTLHIINRNIASPIYLNPCLAIFLYSFCVTTSFFTMSFYEVLIFLIDTNVNRNRMLLTLGFILRRIPIEYILNTNCSSNE